MPYLIDGDNLLWAWDFEGEIEEGRSQLLKILLKFQGRKKSKFIIFFDGPLKENFPSTEYMRVVISSAGIPADETIKELLETQSDCRSIILVSSDRELRYKAKSKRAKVITSPEFIKIVQRVVRKQEKEKREQDITPLEVRLWENIFKRKESKEKKFERSAFSKKNEKE